MSRVRTYGGRTHARLTSSIAIFLRQDGYAIENTLEAGSRTRAQALPIGCEARWRRFRRGLE